MLFYHGQETWEYQNTDDLYTGPEALKKYFPKFETNFTDLTLMSDEAIDSLRNGVLVATLLAQKYSHNPDALLLQVAKILNTLTINNRNYIQSIMVYIVSLINFEEKDIIEINKSITKPLKDIIMTTYDRLIKQGRDQGLEQGQINDILRGFAKGYSIKDLSIITGKEMKEVEAIIAKYSKKG